MDKNSSNVNKKTIKVVNKIYEQLTMLECIRSEMRYFNYDGNDEIIDDNIFKMKELLDNMYELSIQKKCGCPVFKPLKIKEPYTPVPKTPVHNTPKNKVRPSVTTPPDAPRRNILNNILDYDSDDSESNASSNSGSDMSIASDESDESLHVRSWDSVTDTSEDDYIDMDEEESSCGKETSDEESSCCEETSDEETSCYEETDIEGDNSSEEEICVMSVDSDEEYSDADSNYCPYCEEA